MMRRDVKLAERDMAEQALREPERFAENLAAPEPASMLARLLEDKRHLSREGLVNRLSEIYEEMVTAVAEEIEDDDLERFMRQARIDAEAEFKFEQWRDREATIDDRASA